MILSNLMRRIVHATFSTMAHNMDALCTHLSKVLLTLGLEQISTRIHIIICIHGVLRREAVESETLTDAHTIGIMRKHSMHRVQQCASARD